MDGSLIVAILALGIALGSLALALRADRRASRAEGRGQRAELIVEQTGTSSDAKGRRFVLQVRNVGAGVARGVSVWLEDEAGHTVSTVAGDGTLTLSPGDEAVTLTVTVSEDSLPPPPVAFPLLVAWTDGEGHHDRHDSGATAST
jgi:hypothetical protein